MQACYLSNMSRIRECSFEMPNGLNSANTGQRAQIPLLQIFLLELPVRNLERQASSWGIGSTATACITGVKKRGCTKDTNSSGYQTQPSWMHLACHGGRGTKKVTGWSSLCSKADTSFTQREKLTLTLVGTCTVCSKFQTTWETKSFHHPSLSTTGEEQTCSTQNTAQYWTSLECKQ